MRTTLLVTMIFAAATYAADDSSFQFRGGAIRAHMALLSSDLLEGRATGTRGYQLAAQYVASQFEAAGLAPGAGGSYFQQVRFLRSVPGADSELTLLPDRGSEMQFRFGEGFVTTGDPLSADKRIAPTPVVLAGYGITAPELKYDDYAGADVRGRIVAYFSGAPARFPGTLRAHYSSSLVKLENAAMRGAVGVIVLNTRAEAERTPWPRALRQSRTGAMHWLTGDGRPAGVRADLSSSITLSSRAAEALLAASGRSMDEVSAELERGTLRPMPLPLRASMRLITTHEQVQSPNVVGLLPGSDPALRNQYVVYSGHLDHLGITEPVAGDAINNGALDNASGIGAMIEIARAFGSNRTPPRRSIIFLATTAEEKGLRGADYFANNPTVPIEQIVANINIDELLMLGPVRDIVPLGMETSDLGVMARKVAAGMKLDISPDPYPEEVIFVRSDQYPFVRRGVPAIYVSLGYRSSGSPSDPLAQQKEWFRTIYHSPRDDMRQPLDFSMAAMLARYNYLLGVEVANRTAAPAWTPGDFFGVKFGRGKAASR